jgi:hypothetical protein
MGGERVNEGDKGEGVCDEVHLLLWNRANKPLAIALSG